MKIVYSYYCLDILHIGHILMMKKSKEVAGAKSTETKAAAKKETVPAKESEKKNTVPTETKEKKQIIENGGET